MINSVSIDQSLLSDLFLDAKCHLRRHFLDGAYFGTGAIFFVCGVLMESLGGQFPSSCSRPSADCKCCVGSLGLRRHFFDGAYFGTGAILFVCGDLM